jgi:hypothetical protein
VNLVIQNEGLVMGVPSSALLLEVLLQFIGWEHIINFSTKHNVLGYFDYINGILSLWRANMLSRGVLLSVCVTVT